MAASGKLRSRCTRQTTLRGPNNPPSLGRSRTERSKARASGSIMLIWDPPGARELTSPRYRHPHPATGAERRSSECTYSLPVRDSAGSVSPEPGRGHLIGRVVLARQPIEVVLAAAEV